MKRSCISILILTHFVLLGYSQIRELPPARGHYKQLGILNAAPQIGQSEIDTKKFPHNQASVDKLATYKLNYLENVAVEDFEIPDPPANSSEQTRAELNYLLNLQRQRTKLDVESSLYMAGVFYNIRSKPGEPDYAQYRKNLFHIGHSIGTWFNPENLPLTAELMGRVWNDASYFIWALKFKYLRIRPYKLEQQLENLEETNWAAYPSGHAANSYINAFIYQEPAGEFADIFMKDAYDMAHSREIIGVHYPSDSEASRILARQFVNKLFSNPKFQAEFNAVKEEWKQKANESFTKPVVTPSTRRAPASCETSQPECKTIE